MTPDHRALKTLLAGHSLEPALAFDTMAAIMGGHVPPVRQAALLTALELNGVSGAVLAAFARAIRAEMVPVPHSQVRVLDTCGTGGSGLDTPNTSTMAAFVVAAAGVPVAKHGNRSSSGKCGSADLLEAAGVNLDRSPEASGSLLDALGIVFLYAPAHHPAFRHVGPTRKQLGVRTVFNFLGPLCNPAGATHQVIGVSDPARAPMMAGALAELGVERALLVHGEDGLDELTLTGPTRLWMVRDGGVTESVVTPEDLGLKPCAPTELQGGDVDRNLALFRAVVQGDRSPIATLVALNAGAALWTAGATDTLQEGFVEARTLLRSGAAAGTFAVLRARA